MQKYNLKLIKDDTDYVSSFVNGVEYKISKKEDNDLINKNIINNLYNNKYKNI